ncbi:1,5-anhydro-D-fructose reductase-like [Oppia nitens]|uniref:1,5-anhydro-D-fructose reductase-like n=1 Tax=Oppia nitens TaxID=1686743 RepID=UPI0023DA5A76|nr:1,5-anhydro-D-fructose reductase-like [Oppia nitens]
MEKVYQLNQNQRSITLSEAIDNKEFPFHRDKAVSAKTPSIHFVNGFQIPIIGLGTYDMPTNQSVMDNIINVAIDIGYRHIDTAYIYQNEEMIGKTLRDIFANNKTKREDLFITSKVWSTYHKRSAVAEALKLSLNNLGLDYLDLALIHWPIAVRSGTGYLWPLDENNQTLDDDISVVETWKGMEDAYRLGLAKSIGVSNFNSEQLSRVLKHTFIKPVVNQFEIHPYLSQEKLVEFCHNNSIQVIAYCPIGKAHKGLLNEPILTTIASNNNKTVPQVMLRWLIQRDIIIIPKTSKTYRLSENFNIFDFQLTDEEMTEIFKLNKNMRFINPIEAINNKEYPFNREF